MWHVRMCMWHVHVRMCMWHVHVHVMCMCMCMYSVPMRSSSGRVGRCGRPTFAVAAYDGRLTHNNNN